MTDMLKQFRGIGGFWGEYQRLICDVVIPYQEKVLRDEVPGAEKSHALENLRAAAEVIETGSCSEPFRGMVFQDSDVAKWLEAAAYSLLIRPDAELESRCDQVIELMGRAQWEDGYLNTYFTVKEPEKRWTNLQEGHEMYCAGHLMEAAVAYAQCTGKTRLLDIACNLADHLYRRFVREGVPGYPGHPEVELALMRLYRATGEARYRELALHFIDVRGVDSGYFIRERERYPWTVFGLDPTRKDYLQNHLPVRQQTQAVGHAVRAVYLYAAMADLAVEMKDEGLARACRTLWDSVTQKRMYVTGGIGSAYEGEQFTQNYHLPNDTAYSETCASIGLIFFARNMLDLEKLGQYGDVMERALYNCVLAGMAGDGTRFFYVNPLEVIPGISGEAPSHRHALPQRPRWFACACCPPNVARLLTSIAHYAWSLEENTLYSHLFVSGTLDAAAELGGSVRVETRYPLEGEVTYHFLPTGEKMALTLALRLPEWSGDTRILLNGEAVPVRQEKGYAYLSGEFKAGDQVFLSLDMRGRRVYPSPKISALSGRVAFARGPLIYCAEGTDNQQDVISLRVRRDSPITVRSDEAGLGGAVQEAAGLSVLEVEGFRLEDGGGLYSAQPPKATPCTVTLMPYYAWGNRGLTQMRVWLPEETGR